MATLFKALLIVVLLAALFSLGQALFFMMTDRGGSSRTVWALTRRIGFSLLLIALVIIGIATGLLHPHNVGG
ncbi:MAG: twin transmembrane helix small protein [Xanthomonadaceae bacterium]|nr:twin transmembrane helix small protein [Xanthomonadaceae bacterium]MDE2178558.1 twin transmembrane helix small protein [Xanthomonadaceae bacterium]MDE2244727.1 twin transmembrane helix small protein [Xanthomonadaceae bacterium]